MSEATVPTERGVGAEIAQWAADRRAAGEIPPRPAPRTVAEGAVVELREVDGTTVREICMLQVAPAQRRFVAPNAVSFAEAMFEPTAWFRAIYADGVPVGFAMLEADPAAARYMLWRLMIAEDRQGRGYGAAAIGLLVEHVRRQPRATELLVSWVPGDGGPEPFYLGLGFVPTGEIDDGEIVARLVVGPTPDGDRHG